jgi:hypothetical protein
MTPVKRSGRRGMRDRNERSGGYWLRVAGAGLPSNTHLTPRFIALVYGVSRRDRYGGCSSMVELQPSKLATRVRFPSPAPLMFCHAAQVMHCSVRVGVAFSTHRAGV